MGNTDPNTEPKPFGRYLLHRRIASGGMGAVHLARLVGSQGFDKWVAVKTVHARVAADPAFADAFAREARLCARIDHPNVCQVFDFGEEQGTPYLAMEFLKGEPLNKLMSNASKTKNPVPFGVAARIVADAARGLHAAHELVLPDGRHAGVVHRDVSPQNVFVLFSGIAKVVDFGVARWQEELSEQTRSGSLRGKIAYMSPEQARGERLDRRSDVFSLGILLWEMLTNERLFGGDSEAHTLQLVEHKVIESPNVLRPEVPLSLANITMQALARWRDQRYGSAELFARDLERWLAIEARGMGATEVAGYLNMHFGDRARGLEELLRTQAMAPVPTSGGGLASVTGQRPASINPPRMPGAQGVDGQGAILAALATKPNASPLARTQPVPPRPSDFAAQAGQPGPGSPVSAAPVRAQAGGISTGTIVGLVVLAVVMIGGAVGFALWINRPAPVPVPTVVVPTAAPVPVVSPAPTAAAPTAVPRVVVPTVVPSGWPTMVPSAIPTVVFPSGMPMPTMFPGGAMPTVVLPPGYVMPTVMPTASPTAR